MKTEEEIRTIAAQDARRIYRDLSIYDVTAARNEGIWEVSFILKDKELDGGGPFYRIDAESGSILEKVYYQ